MTRLLDKAFAEIPKFSQEEQDSLAAWILAEIVSEQRRKDSYAKSADSITLLTDEALEEHQEGRTEELDPDTL